MCFHAFLPPPLFPNFFLQLSFRTLSSSLCCFFPPHCAPLHGQAGYRMMSVVNPDLCRRVAFRYTVALLPICLAAPAMGRPIPNPESSVTLHPFADPLFLRFSLAIPCSFFSGRTHVASLCRGLHRTQPLLRLPGLGILSHRLARVGSQVVSDFAVAFAGGHGSASAPSSRPLSQVAGHEVLSVSFSKRFYSFLLQERTC